MKKLGLIAPLIAAAVLTSCMSLGTPYEGETLKQYIFEVPNKSMDDLFVIANSWMVDAFINADNVIQYSDKEAGIVKGKFTTTFGSTFAYSTLRVTATIEVIGSRVRLSFGNPVKEVGIYGSTVTEDDFVNLSADLDVMAASLGNVLNTSDYKAW